MSKPIIATAAERGAEITSIGNEGDKTADQILEEMNSLWYKAKKIWREKRIIRDNHKELDDVYDTLRKEHPQLHMAYPTVVKHALLEMNYHPKAFQKYLRRLQVKMWTSDEERLESYADYAVLLYKALNPGKWNPAQMAAFKQDYMTRITSEHKKFEDEYKKHAEQIAKEESQYDKERRKELEKLLSQMRLNMNQ